MPGKKGPPLPFPGAKRRKSLFYEERGGSNREISFLPRKKREKRKGGRASSLAFVGLEAEGRERLA